MSTKKELYRDPENGKVAGVCAGIAEYFGWELWLVRIIVISGCLLSGSFFFVAYIAAWFILDKKPRPGASPKPSHFTFQGKGWQNKHQEEEKTVEVKSKVWQSGEPPKRAFYDINKRFLSMETKLRKIESYVTSSEFQLNKEISKL